MLINLAWNLPHPICTRNDEGAKKTQTKERTPLLLDFALLAEHLVRNPFIQRHALRSLFHLIGLISGMAWEGAECPGWVHGFDSWGEQEQQVCSAARQEMVLLWGSKGGMLLFSRLPSLADSPAGLLCPLPAPQVPAGHPHPVLRAKARGGDLWAGNAAHWAAEMALLVMSVYLSPGARRVLLFTLQLDQSKLAFSKGISPNLSSCAGVQLTVLCGCVWERGGTATGSVKVPLRYMGA